MAAMGMAAMGRGERLQAFHLGLDAEVWAALWLRAKGYRILARRYLRAGAEIDLIIARRRTLAFVEVKARASLDEALQAITEAKAERIARAGRVFLASQPVQPEVIRFDAVLVAPWQWPRHIEAISELPLE